MNEMRLMSELRRRRPKARATAWSETGRKKEKKKHVQQRGLSSINSYYSIPEGFLPPSRSYTPFLIEPRYETTRTHPTGPYGQLFSEESKAKETCF